MEISGWVNRVLMEVRGVMWRIDRPNCFFEACSATLVDDFYFDWGYGVFVSSSERESLCN